MEDKQLVMKIKLDPKREGSIAVKTNLSSWSISYNETLHNIMSWSLSILLDTKELMKMVWAQSTFSNLKELIKQGFVVRIDKNEKGYNLIVSKGKCSIAFNAPEEKGIVNVVLQAEDWAVEMLEQLNCGNVEEV